MAASDVDVLKIKLENEENDVVTRLVTNVTPSGYSAKRQLENKSV